MKYNRADLQSACRAAQRASAKDGRVRFVQATAYGFAVSTSRMPVQSAYWTDGGDVVLNEYTPERAGAA
jgi:hypothetical protein